MEGRKLKNVMKKIIFGVEKRTKRQCPSMYLCPALACHLISKEMKRIILLLVLFTSITTINAQEIINYFEVASNIAKPVTMKTSKGTYTIWGGERIEGNLGWMEAWDANGNKIVNTSPYKTEIGTNKPTIRRYRFKDLYKSSSSSSTKNTSNTRGRNNEWSSKMADYASRGVAIAQDGYPNLQIRVGASIFMAEYASLKAELGGAGGFVLCGGMGKSIFDNTILGKSWYAGLGYYGGDEDYCFSLDFIYMDSHIIESRILSFELEFSYFFGGGRFGCFADAQLGLCFDKETVMFNVGAGIAWKLFE